ncbi:YbgA family protein [Clostridium manihotivorum]|uniref:DUF1722 domain-containing protein n=1 Tax=Clostridium manihotivorum TaxID=2320868 RepID=A0A410DY94_9CLOT|nr:DUF523 and DUF1722 domain-containing protein [Clostridium manihotivorum]QAA33902.1 DUF1722 domain-containing protein [Clostridium manihotivorum]
MQTWAKPKIVVSKCLGNTACRYNGEASTFSLYIKLKPFVEFIEVCPEMAIGLPVPREVIRLVREKDTIKLVESSSLKEYTEDMINFSTNFIDNLKGVNGFLLKSRSPSCGTRDVKIYQGTAKGAQSSKGKGIFGGLVQDRFSYLPIEEDGRLKNFAIRDHFLSSIFTLSEFSDVQEHQDLPTLLKYHSRHKLLFMSYNQTELKNLGRIVANHDHLSETEIIDAYYTGLLKLLSKTPRYTSNINVFMHSFGYFSEYLNPKERDFMLSVVEKYRAGKIPLSVLLNLLKSQAIRFNNQYLLDQSFLEPYPEELIDISDSGKGVTR